MASYTSASSQYSLPVAISETSDDFRSASSSRYSIYYDASDQSEEVDKGTMAKDDVVSVLTTSIAGFERVVEHLRLRGEPEIANKFAKSMLDMISDFNNVTADWDIQKCVMEDPKPVRTNQATNQGGSAPQAEPISDHIANLQTGSWAAVAAIPASVRNDLVVHRPGDGMQRSVTDQPDDDGVFVPESEARVVWIKPKQIDVTINTKMVSNVINQGPLLSVAYSPAENAVCVIFQHPQHAREFLEVDQQSWTRNGYGILGSAYNALPGLGYSNTEELRRMDHPKCERRRLTFVRAALFCDNLTEAKFKSDIVRIVGEDHVELVWLFNTGNATVIFSGVAVARKCKEEFLQIAKARGPYHGMHVSYSHDPCERPLQLVTQMNDPFARKNGPPRSIGLSYRPNPMTANGGVPRPRVPSPRRQGIGHNKEENGWQTVGSRRR